MGGCQPWCCEHNPCRALACPNAFPYMDPLLQPLPISIPQASGSDLQAVTSPLTAAGAESQPYVPPSAPALAEPEEIPPPPPPATLSSEQPCPPPTARTSVVPPPPPAPWGQPQAQGPADAESQPFVPPSAPVLAELPPLAPSLLEEIPPPPSPAAALFSDQPPPPARSTQPQEGPPPTQPDEPEQEGTTPVPPRQPQPPYLYAGEGSGAPPAEGQREASGGAQYIGDYPPPGYRPYGGGDIDDRPRRGRTGRDYYDQYEDFGRHRESGARPTTYERECVPLRSQMGLRRCHQYYPNDYYLNNMPRYRMIDRRADFNDEPPPPRSRGARYQGMDNRPIDDDDARGDREDFDSVRLRRHNSCPMRERRSSGHHENERELDDDRGPGTLVRDNVVIGDPRGVTIGEGNRGGRRTGGRVTGNVVIR